MNDHLYPASGNTADPRRLAQDFRSFVGDVETLLRNGKDLSGEGLAVARARLEEQVAQAKTKLDTARAAATAHADAAVDATQGYVRREPLRALGIAAAVGAVVALFLSRR